ncbi:MAG: type II secretion system protein [Clostridia bacterium]|nr:type II secretion system protein [Clostridia bacterium]
MKVLKNKRGFTLVETVVALALILIISASSLTLISSANNATQRALYNAQAQNFVSDVVTVYRRAESRQEFDDALTDGILAPLPKGYEYDIHIEGTTLTVEVINDNQKTVAKATYVRGGELS